LTHVEEKHTIWEDLGASLGLWAAALLALQLALMLRVTADVSGSDAEFASALVAERPTWEWMTFLRIVAGLQIVWWMGSLSTRLRRAEGEPGRLSGVVFAVGAVWGGVWLASAFLNSAAILLATDYANPAGSRLAATLALETPFVLTPATMFALTWATSLAVLRFGGFPRWYGWATQGVSGLLLVLAIVDWYGSGSLSVAILAVALVWTAATSAVLLRSQG